MKLTNWIGGVLVVVAAFAVTGCGVTASNPSDISGLTEDSNGNGFPERQPPEGISLEDGTINISIDNAIGRSEIATLAASQGFDAGLLNAVTVMAKMVLTLDYGNGITDTVTETRQVAPFELPFEVACPDSAEIYAEVYVIVPIVGNQQVFQQTFEVSSGVEYECGQTIMVNTYVDDSGNPRAELSVE